MSATVDLALVPGAGMPDATNTECTLLGGILLNTESIWQVSDIVVAADFAQAKHGHIYDAMLALAQRGDTIDVALLRTELETRGRLAEAGGPNYLMLLETCLPASPNAAKYAKAIADKAILRRVAKASQITLEEAKRGEGEVDGILDRASARILEATQRQSADAPVSVGEILPGVYDGLQKRFERQNEVTGLSSGLTMLDKKTAGFQPGDLVVVAGRPAMGKTTLAMQIAEHCAVDIGEPALVFSLEMPRAQLVERMLAGRARVSASRIKTGLLLDSDWPKLARASDQLFRAPLEILDTGEVSVLRVRQECRRFKARRKKLGCVVIDYLQLMKGQGEENREQEISGISRGLKALAKELGCPVIALSQLNRTLERREDKRPVMSDLRESGAIEQDADTIIFVYRDEVYHEDSSEKGMAEHIIGKQRNGSIGWVKTAFVGEYVRFENLADDERRYGSH